jgi:hypothetical protein
MVFFTAGKAIDLRREWLYGIVERHCIDVPKV